MISGHIIIKMETVASAVHIKKVKKKVNGQFIMLKAAKRKRLTGAIMF